MPCQLLSCCCLCVHPPTQPAQHAPALALPRLRLACRPPLTPAQVVSDYLTAFDDPMAMMEANGRPVVVYTYKMAFRRPAEGAAQAAGQGAAV